MSEYEQKDKRKGSTKEFCSHSAVNVHSLAILVHESQVEHCIGVPQLDCLLVIRNCLLVVHLHSMPALVHHSDIVPVEQK